MRQPVPSPHDQQPVNDCAFCERTQRDRMPGRKVVSFPDSFPVSRGHTLIVPVQHEADFFVLEPALQAEIWREVTSVRDELARTLMPHGFNVGLNAGPAAGQTVPHAHVHVIPRYRGDRDDPRGGVRWVLPDKADYWTGHESAG